MTFNVGANSFAQFCDEGANTFAQPQPSHHAAR